MQGVWNCVQFWVCSAACVSALQLVGILLMLPPIFTTGECFSLFLIRIVFCCRREVSAIGLGDPRLSAQLLASPGCTTEGRTEEV